MKKKNLIKNLLATTSIALLLFTACSNEEANNTEISNTESSNIEYSEPASGNEEVTTEEKIDIEKKLNPLGLLSKIYNRSEKDHFLDKDNNVKYLASIVADNKAHDEKEYVGITVDYYNGNEILIDYIYASNDELSEGKGERYLELYDKNTGKMMKKVVVSSESAFVEKKSESICVESKKDGIFTVQSYDYKLNQIAMFTTKEDDTIVKITNDGKRMYYMKQNKLWLYDSQTNTSKEYNSDNKFLVHYITDVVTDENGNDYVLFDGMAADYNTYKFIYDVNKERLIRVDEQDVIYESHGSFLTSNQLNEEEYFYLSWIVGISESKAFYYDLNDEIKKNEKNVQLLVMQNGDLLFNCSDDNNVYVDLYDKDTGKLKGSTSFSVSGIRRAPLDRLPEAEMEFYTNEMGIYDKAFYISENVILLTLTDFYGTKYYLEWNLENNIDNKMITVSEHKIGSIKPVDISGFDNELLTPGELSEALKPLNVEVEKIEKKYDISIKIGEECSNICSGYLVYPLTDYELVKDALDVLEEELAEYPANFFSQFKYEDNDGLEFYISSDIIGISEENLGIAGGFKYADDGIIKIIIDCDTSDVLDSTLHHELCHAIDDVMEYKKIYDGISVFSEEKWNSLNPYEDMYSNSYVEWGKEKYWDEYSYDNIILNSEYDEEEIIGAYFIDTYAMTYPTEDRARLFENIMRDEGKYVDFSKSPYLRAKVNYLAECIRATFDTTGWGDVPWEAYME